MLKQDVQHLPVGPRRRVGAGKAAERKPDGAVQRAALNALSEQPIHFVRGLPDLLERDDAPRGADLSRGAHQRGHHAQVAADDRPARGAGDDALSDQGRGLACEDGAQVSHRLGVGVTAQAVDHRGVQRQPHVVVQHHRAVGEPDERHRRQRIGEQVGDQPSESVAPARHPDRVGFSGGASERLQARRVWAREVPESFEGLRVDLYVVAPAAEHLSARFDARRIHRSGGRDDANTGAGFEHHSCSMSFL